MLKSTRFDLGDEIKFEIGNQIICLLLFLFLVLAIYLVDVEPAVDSIYVVPVVTLTIVFMVVCTIMLLGKGFAVYRWIPVLGLLIIAPVIIFAYHHVIILLLLPSAITISIIIINLRTGFLFSVIATALVFWLGKTASLPSGWEFYTIIGVWIAFGITFLMLRIIVETVTELNKKYSENKALLDESRDRQGKLIELISERTEGNVQLLRLNQLANHLRQVAEDERKIKEEFVARVSHELRTPLNMIIGYCTVLMETNGERMKRLPRSIVEDLEIIFRNSQHLSKLINDILDLSQINAGQMAIVKEEADIKEAIYEAISSVKPLFDSKNLYLRPMIQTPLPKVICDRTRIVETLLNLLSNAGRFTLSGGVTIDAKVVNQWLEIRVIDTGIGLSKKKQDRLFDPFYQVNGSIRQAWGGTGLGLSISKKIVELHGGRMWVESEEGKGAAFIFQLPVSEPIGEQSDVKRWFNPYLPDPKPPARPLISPEKIKPRIVIVDQDGDLTKLLQRYSDEGEYISASDIPGGIDEVNHSPARLMLVNTDQISHDLESLRSSENLPFGIPAVLCSIPTSLQNKIKWDIYDILVKPISMQELVRSIDNIGPGIKTVLVIDDDPDVRRLLKRMIQKTKGDITVVTAANGVHGIQALKRHSVDAILLDLVMPRMDGYQFLEAKKKLPGIKDIPVILISGHQLQERPIVSDGLGIVLRGGITIKQFLQCLSALSAALGS